MNFSTGGVSPIGNLKYSENSLKFKSRYDTKEAF